MRYCLMLGLCVSFLGCNKTEDEEALLDPTRRPDSVRPLVAKDIEHTVAIQANRRDIQDLQASDREKESHDREQDQRLDQLEERGGGLATVQSGEYIIERPVYENQREAGLTRTNRSEIERVQAPPPGQVAGATPVPSPSSPAAPSPPAPSPHVPPAGSSVPPGGDPAVADALKWHKTEEMAKKGEMAELMKEFRRMLREESGMDTPSVYHGTSYRAAEDLILRGNAEERLYRQGFNVKFLGPDEHPPALSKLVPFPEAGPERGYFNSYRSLLRPETKTVYIRHSRRTPLLLQ